MMTLVIVLRVVASQRRDRSAIAGSDFLVEAPVVVVVHEQQRRARGEVREDEQRKAGRESASGTV